MATNVYTFLHVCLFRTAKLRPERARLGSGVLVGVLVWLFWKLGRYLPGVSAAAISASNFKSVSIHTWRHQSQSSVRLVCSHR